MHSLEQVTMVGRSLIVLLPPDVRNHATKKRERHPSNFMNQRCEWLVWMFAIFFALHRGKMPRKQSTLLYFLFLPTVLPSRS